MLVMSRLGLDDFRNCPKAILRPEGNLGAGITGAASCEKEGNDQQTLDPFFVFVWAVLYTMTTRHHHMRAR